MIESLRSSNGLSPELMYTASGDWEVSTLTSLKEIMESKIANQNKIKPNSAYENYRKRKLIEKSTDHFRHKNEAHLQGSLANLTSASYLWQLSFNTWGILLQIGIVTFEATKYCCSLTLAGNPQHE